MRPITASEALKVISPRKFLGNTLNLSNRFSQLRNHSPADSSRHRSVSTKRKVSYESSYAAAAARNLEESMDSEVSSMTGINLAKVSSLCDKLSSGIETSGCEPNLQVILMDIAEAIKLTNSVQQDLFNARGSSASQTRTNTQAAVSNLVSLGAVPKRLKTNTLRDSSTDNTVSQFSYAAGTNQVPVAAPASLDSPELANFKETVREAEKSTLVFNLDMGTVPLMNTETMCKKATLALTKMAAQVEVKLIAPLVAMLSPP